MNSTKMDKGNWVASNVVNKNEHIGPIKPVSFKYRQTYSWLEVLFR